MILSNLLAETSNPLRGAASTARSTFTRSVRSKNVLRNGTLPGGAVRMAEGARGSARIERSLTRPGELLGPLDLPGADLTGKELTMPVVPVRDVHLDRSVA